MWHLRAFPYNSAEISQMDHAVCTFARYLVRNKWRVKCDSSHFILLCSTALCM